MSGWLGRGWLLAVVCFGRGGVFCSGLWVWLSWSRAGSGLFGERLAGRFMGCGFWRWRGGCFGVRVAQDFGESMVVGALVLSWHGVFCWSVF